MGKKKLFISCPMKGRTDENIKRSMAKMHKIAEAVFEQELDAIDTYIEEDPPEGVNAGVQYLGKSIEMMAGADYFIGMVRSSVYNGCLIESKIAGSYDIPMFTLTDRDILTSEEYFQIFGV